MIINKNVRLLCQSSRTISPILNNVNVIMNDTRIWSAAQMRALFPLKKPNACITFKPKMH